MPAYSNYFESSRQLCHEISCFALPVSWMVSASAFSPFATGNQKWSLLWVLAILAIECALSRLHSVVQLLQTNTPHSFVTGSGRDRYYATIIDLNIAMVHRSKYMVAVIVAASKTNIAFEGICDFIITLFPSLAVTCTPVIVWCNIVLQCAISGLCTLVWIISSTKWKTAVTRHVDEIQVMRYTERAMRQAESIFGNLPLTLFDDD